MMPEHDTSCDRGRIERFLGGRLSTAERLEFESHLDACVDCRDRLETTAAGHDYWTEAAVCLRDDALDHLAESCDGSGLAETDTLGESQRFGALRITDYFDPTDDPRMLGRFGGYEIVGVVGCGGMGVVLKGFEPALDRYVAIKVLAPHLATSGAARARFAREARAAAAVLHENVVAIHRVSEAAGLPFLVMPYVGGHSLQKRLNAHGPLQLNEILRIAMQAAAGLAAAHAQGLVHRDITPGNILLDSGVERVTITDFGLARAADDASLTCSGVIAGTPQYMSPEQARGEPLDGRSDLFSLGSVLYAICTGRPPFRAETTFGVLQRIRESSPSPIRDLAPETPEWLCEIVAKLHEKDPERRFSSAQEVAELLGRWLAHVQQPAIILAPPRITRRGRLPKRWWHVAAALGLVAAAVWSIALAAGLLSGDGGPDDQSEVVQADSPATAPDEATEAVAMRLGFDEQALYDDYRNVQQRTAQMEQAWSRSSTGGDGFEATIMELDRLLGDLRRRVDQNLP